MSRSSHTAKAETLYRVLRRQNEERMAAIRAVADEDFRIVPCEACGSEGYESYTATVYEPGCGFGHDDVFLDYSRPCPVCEGTGGAVIPVEPITLDDLLEMEGN
jgi:hypothetical protein